MVNNSETQCGYSHNDDLTPGNVEIENNSVHNCAENVSLTDGDHSPAANHLEAVFIVITLALMSTIFLAALDVNILSIVIPTVTTDFGSMDNVSWYGASYSLTKMALQPTFGRAYYLWPLKPVLLFSIALFSGALTLAAFAVSKKKLPLFISILSTIAAVPTIIITIFYTESDRETTRAGLVDKLTSFDPIGTALLVGAITTLVLALQWGGTQAPWSSPGVWGTLLASAALVGLFIVV
ncbi:hypothetical protein F4782DRAFT_536414 [Xylaria castorea]|nr:hypothetical protein F4782DRAFT_536414 [Xylaria castorea]